MVGTPGAAGAVAVAVVGAAVVAGASAKGQRMTRSLADLARALLLACLLTAPLAHAQKHYPTPEAAAEALVKAMRANDTPALQAVLGQEWSASSPPTT